MRWWKKGDPAVQASDGSVAIGKSYFGTIKVTNFIGRSQRLADSYLDPTLLHRMVFDERFNERFSGREWLVDEIESFIQQYDRGYFVIEADAGMGKTAFALWLSGQCECPCHFTRISKDARTTACAVRNLTAQLIRKWDLEKLAPKGHLPGEGTDQPSWLLKVVTQAAQRRNEQRRNERDRSTPIVLVVDGLDEAEEHEANHLPLGLPSLLPVGVYVVATVRTGRLNYQPQDTPLVICKWNEWRKKNLDDLRTHLTYMVQQSWLADKIRADRMTPETFIESVLGRCGQVWVYLSYVLREIKNDLRSPRDVDRLPRDLWTYYDNNITELCPDSAEGAWRLRLLSALAVIEEPLNARTLSRFADVNDDGQRVEQFLYGRMRPFCTVLSADGSADGQERFDLYHASLREYLAGGSGPERQGRLEAVRALRVRLSSACGQTQHRICDRYLTAWGGLPGLPVLAQNPAAGMEDGGYGLRWLTTHLLATDRTADLHQLLKCGQEKRNLWYAAHEHSGDIAGFLADIDRARRTVLRDAGRRPARRATQESIGLELRYTLIEASIASASANLPAALLEQLIKSGEWTPQQAFSHIERMADEQVQAQALARVATQLPNQLLERALSIACACQDKEHCSLALQALIPCLPDDLPDDLWDLVVETVTGRILTTMQPKVAAVLAAHLPQPRLAQLCRNAPSEIREDQRRLFITAPAALRMSNSRGQGISDALARIRRIDNSSRDAKVSQPWSPICLARLSMRSSRSWRSVQANTGGTH